VLFEEFFQNRDWPTAAAIACALLVVLLVVPASVVWGFSRHSHASGNPEIDFAKQ
jgi:ABC-type spermidine/putrescine transport system permease subunit I